MLHSCCSNQERLQKVFYTKCKNFAEFIIISQTRIQSLFLLYSVWCVTYYCIYSDLLDVLLTTWWSWKANFHICGQERILLLLNPQEVMVFATHLNKQTREEETNPKQMNLFGIFSVSSVSAKLTLHYWLLHSSLAPQTCRSLLGRRWVWAGRTTRQSLTWTPCLWEMN